MLAPPLQPCHEGRAMRIVASLVASALFASAAFAQSAPPGNPPPPPGMNDPGVHATAPAPAGSMLQHATPRLPTMHDNARDARGEPPPEVSVRQRGDDTVQEYRRNGQLYMVVVTPKNGIAQTYTVDPQGRLVDEHGQKPTRPVMYKVLEWGKSRPAEAGSGGD
jgi:hypothetical protein